MRERGLLYFALGVTTVLSLGTVTNQVQGMGQAYLALDDTGITFPDGTMQTTAAAGPVTAWPMRCRDSSVGAGDNEDLTCTSVLSVPGGSFGGPGDGVPEGYFLVVTDVHVEPGHDALTTTGFVFAQLRRKDSIGNIVQREDFKLSNDNESKLTSFNAPLFVLGQGDYLNALNLVYSTHECAITVTGYLTDQPENLRL